MMRDRNGSAEITPSTAPPFSASLMVGKVTSTKVIFAGSMPCTISDWRNSTSRNAPIPGTPTRWPTKSAGFSMPEPVRATSAAPSAVSRLVTEAVASTTRSSPPSTACKNTEGVGPPIWMESDTSAAGMLELSAIGVIFTSSPCLAKKP